MPPLTIVEDLAQKRTLVLSSLLTSMPGAARPPSSNFKMVPGMACHCAMAARSAFNSLVLFAEDQASDARKKRIARVFGSTTLVWTMAGKATRSQCFWAPLETRAGTNARVEHAASNTPVKMVAVRFMVGLP